MRYLIPFFLLPLSAQADPYCDELWFTRNLIFDRAGYCFGSSLGQAVFDNSDCSTKTPALTDREKAQVASLKETEEFLDCRTDTSRSRLEFTGGDWLRTFETLPTRAEGESSCIDFKGPELPLYSGASETSAIIGAISVGDDPPYGHLAEGAWEFVTIGEQRGGWTNVNLFEGNRCEAYAG